MLNRRMKDFSLFFPLFSIPSIHCYSSLYLYTQTLCLFLFFSLLHNLFIHFALNLCFLCSLSFCLLWFCFLLPLLQGQHQGLGQYCSSTREWEDTVIYISSGHSACPGSFHGPCHQTLCFWSTLFFFSWGVWISHVMFCRVLLLCHTAHQLSTSAGSAAFIATLELN